MSNMNVWKTVSIRYELLDALHKIAEKSEDAEDRPTRVVDRLVREHLEEKGVVLVQKEA